jgi:hypothetical protein
MFPTSPPSPGCEPPTPPTLCQSLCRVRVRHPQTVARLLIFPLGIEVVAVGNSDMVMVKAVVMVVPSVGGGVVVG